MGTGVAGDSPGFLRMAPGAPGWCAGGEKVNSVDDMLRLILRGGERDPMTLGAVAALLTCPLLYRAPGEALFPNDAGALANHYQLIGGDFHHFLFFAVWPTNLQAGLGFRTESEMQPPVVGR